MAGGVGSRFWPMSTSDYPKQFIDVLGCGRTLIQMTMDRFKDICPLENVWVVTSDKYADEVKRQLPEILDDHILREPCRRNTAPCVAYVSWKIKARNPKANMVVTPSDHVVLDVREFQRVIRSALKFTNNSDAILTLGMKPSRPETGYGYIQIGESMGESISKVKTFTEKPNLELAKVFLSTGEFFWNSGMFLWSVDSILKAVQECAPEIAQLFEKGQGLYGTEKETEFIKQNFAACPGISIDFAVMEKAKNVYVECVDFGWDDLGTWGALYDNSPKNHEGNVTENCNAMLFDCKDCMVASKGDKLIVASQLKDYIIAAADDVVLIVPKSEEQKIKLYVNEVKSAFGDKYL